MNIYQLDNSVTIQLENNLIVTITKYKNHENQTHYHLNVPYQYLGNYPDLKSVNQRLKELEDSSKLTHNGASGNKH
jgi:hypothetical protein